MSRLLVIVSSLDKGVQDKEGNNAKTIYNVKAKIQEGTSFSLHEEAAMEGVAFGLVEEDSFLHEQTAETIVTPASLDPLSPRDSMDTIIVAEKSSEEGKDEAESNSLSTFVPYTSLMDRNADGMPIGKVGTTHVTTPSSHEVANVIILTLKAVFSKVNTKDGLTSELFAATSALDESIIIKRWVDFVSLNILLQSSSLDELFNLILEVAAILCVVIRSPMIVIELFRLLLLGTMM
ncbi:hypothetical protein ACLOJK_040576 [Asimina triloba]